MIGYCNDRLLHWILSISQSIDTKDELFWEKLWSESVDCVQDIFTLMPASEVPSSTLYTCVYIYIVFDLEHSFKLIISYCECIKE